VGRGTVLPVRILDRRAGLLTLGHGETRISALDPGGLEGEDAFLWIRAEDVLLEPRLAPSTARNALPAVIRTLEAAPPLVRVHLEAPFALEALVTPSAIAELDLREGSAVHAVIKASALRVMGR
jgi:molybdopterin-binding protein